MNDNKRIEELTAARHGQHGRLSIAIIANSREYACPLHVEGA
jgi:hypothetical protein